MIVFANSRLDGSEAVIGHLVIHTSNGARSFLGARAPGQIELGRISLAQGGSVVTQGASKLKIECGCGGESEGGGDYSCHENDDECNQVCDDGGDDDMECENEPGDDCESDDLDDEGGKGTCEQHVHQSCGGSGSSSGSSSGGAPSGGGSCQVNAQCGSGVCSGAVCLTH
jgi:hypothetical protein